MTILSSELKAYYADEMSDLDTSGGRITPATSAHQITSGALQNVFPHIFRAQRLAGCIGSPQHRKIFYRNCNDADESLFSASTYLFRPNPSEAWVWKVIGTQRSTKADLAGTEAKFGPGLLHADVAAAATVLVVDVKHTRMTGCFAVGRPTRISNKATAASTTGSEEEFTPSAVSVSGTQVTLTIPSPGLSNGYTAGATTFSVYYPSSSELKCSVDNWSESTNTYDEGSHPVTCDNIGTTEQTWTIERLSNTSFSCTGDRLGALATGSTGSDYAPLCPLTGKPYFTLAAAGWLGSLPSGYTLTFQTHPPAIAVHEFREWPAGVSSFAGDGITLVLEGETV